MDRKYLSLIILLSLLSACSGIQQRPAPEQDAKAIEKRHFRQFENGPRSRERLDGISGLLKKADEADRAQDFSLAVVHMERAIRIQPQNPLLWHRLAMYKFKMGDYGRALQFAKRSNSFAGSDMEMRVSNDEIIAQAREMMGK